MYLDVIVYNLITYGHKDGCKIMYPDGYSLVQGEYSLQETLAIQHQVQKIQAQGD